MPSRLPRFKRAASVSPIGLTKRDRQIIDLVHQHRFLSSCQLIACIGHSAQTVLRRLQLLYHHGYLERPRAQLEYYHRGGSHSIVYGLGNKGAALLKKELGPSIRSDWGPKNRTVGRFFLEHTLLVSEVMVVIELSSRKAGVRLLMETDLLNSTTIRNAKNARWNVKVVNTKLGVVPDRIFGLEFKNTAGLLTRAYFFLEADRGTMPVVRKNLSQTSIYRKLLAYEATWNQGIHRERFGFHRFRVLTVTASAERKQSLIDACAQLKRGHGLFLFADKSILEKPEEILSAVMQTGRPVETSSLLD